jgi:serine/threonine protein kinase
MGVGAAMERWLQVMAPNRKIHALKRIKLQGRDREAATGFIDEIALLQRLRGHSNIIQLIDAEVSHHPHPSHTCNPMRRGPRLWLWRIHEDTWCVQW